LSQNTSVVEVALKTSLSFAAGSEFAAIGLWMIDTFHPWIFARMALATHATRVGGYAVVRNLTLSLGAKAVLEATPGRRSDFGDRAPHSAGLLRHFTR
jgi:hypothetical protein